MSVLITNERPIIICFIFKNKMNGDEDIVYLVFSEKNTMKVICLIEKGQIPIQNQWGHKISTRFLIY